MPHPGISGEMTGIDLNSEQIVLVTSIRDDKAKDVEWETAAAENANLEEITGVDPQIKGVDPTEK